MHFIGDRFQLTTFLKPVVNSKDTKFHKIFQPIYKKINYLKINYLKIVMKYKGTSNIREEITFCHEVRF